MATFYASKATNVFNTNPPVKASPSAHGGIVRCMTDTITYASQASGSTIVFGGGYLPVGARVLYGTLTTSVSTGSATVSIGISGATAKYKALAAYTTADVPLVFGVAGGLDTALTAAEQIIATTGGASLPASGTLTVSIFYVVD